MAAAMTTATTITYETSSFGALEGTVGTSTCKVLTEP
jgi:hypothetical protein